MCLAQDLMWATHRCHPPSQGSGPALMEPSKMPSSGVWEIGCIAPAASGFVTRDPPRPGPKKAPPTCSLLMLLPGQSWTGAPTSQALHPPPEEAGPMGEPSLCCLRFLVFQGAQAGGGREEKP